MSIAIVTDSTSYLDQNYIDAHKITILPLTTTFSDGTYVEGQDISPEEFYQKMTNLNEIPTSSQPSSGVITEKLNALSQDYDHLLVITISSGISGTAQTIQALSQSITDAQVHVIDSQLTCLPQAFMVEKAVDMVAASAEIDDILAALEEQRQHIEAYFIVDDLQHLAKGGRLSQAGALMGGLLKIKPLLYFKDGKIEVFDKIRTSKKAAGRILEMLAEADARVEGPLRIGVVGNEDSEMVQYLMREIADRYPEYSLSRSYFGPVIGTHLGDGAYGVGWTVQ
ncbi:DegV family protein [Aerococcus kribbianus]|uniref:DegV family protein n=1 Tax=Aerococcus kribbianus TaxID=2999064 RepID=A0A9X3FNF9_9LACT|nr:MULTISPECIES: DegV family protein [unclassified Aerococcus]MCZ0717504.1 DegV family protein [Aerococcus sp. YH-aer221]MCZ0725792.1 DegV family protein [Aerococcus sp. YH-aer222]